MFYIVFPALEKDVQITSGFNYDVVTRVDKLLEEAYNMLNIYNSKSVFQLVYKHIYSLPKLHRGYLFVSV